MIRRASILALGLALGSLCACATSGAEEGSSAAAEARLRKTVVHVDGMTWPVGWGGRVSRALEGLDGVQQVTMHYERKEFEVLHDPTRIDEAALLSAVRSTGDERGDSFQASIGPRDSRPEPQALTPTERAQLDVSVISTGQRVDLDANLVSGKFTVFDYYADWCGPCHALARDLERLALERGDVAIRKIDIVDWKSEAAKQATEAYRIKGIPYLRIYGPSGRYLGDMEGNSVARVRDLLSETP